MATPPVVSVVIPVYNHERFVEEAIQSVFDQGCRPLELIIIDDGSTDSSAEVVRSMLERGVPEDVQVTFRSRPNRGACETLNEGLREATGTWLTVLNSDDAYAPDRLNRCLAALEANRARILFTYVQPIDGAGADLAIDHPFRVWYNATILQELDQAPTLSTLLLWHNIGISTGNLIFHRSLYEELNGFSEFRYTHDIDFLLRASATDEPVLFRQTLYRYRLHANNTILENDQKTEIEYQAVIARYLQRTLTVPTENPFAPRLDRWPSSFGTKRMPAYLARALDGLLDSQPAPGATQLAPADPIASSSAPSRSAVQKSMTLISHELSYTGAPVLLRDVATELAQHGVLGSVISARSGPLTDDFETIGYRVKRDEFLQRVFHFGELVERNIDQLPDFKNLAAWCGRKMQATSIRLRILKNIRKTKGVLLINSFASWPLALPILERWRGPAFWYIHETLDPSLLMHHAKNHKRLEALFARGAVTMMYGSDATREVWARAGYDGLVRYWSGLPADHGATAAAERTSGARADRDGNPASRRVILSVQTTSTRKGTRSLIEAFAYGRREGLIPPDVELRIVGCRPPSKYPLTRDLIVRVNEPDLKGSVRLVAEVPPAELEAYYRTADLYVQSSIMECLPLALLTALAHGLPIVSTDADGCREAVEHGVTGLLVPPRQIACMAEALGELLNDPERGRALGAAARERFVRCFALEATVPVLMETLFPGIDSTGPE